MKTFRYSRALQAAFIGIAIFSATTLARADIKDYEFQLVAQNIQDGPEKIITVRLINKAPGKPVPDAVIFATRLDMAPDGMQEMATKIVPMPGGESGIYKFKATFGMAGRARSKTNCSSRRRKEARHPRRYHRRRVDRGGGWRIRRCSRAPSFDERLKRDARFAGGCAG